MVLLQKGGTPRLSLQLGKMVDCTGRPWITFQNNANSSTSPPGDQERGGEPKWLRIRSSCPVTPIRVLLQRS